MVIERAAMLGIPAVAIALTAAVLLGPGATRPAVGARVYGAPAAAPAPVAVRVVTLTSLFGVEEVTSVDELAVARDGQRLWSGATGADGVAEATWLPAGPSEPIEILSKGRVLARGVLDLSRDHPVAIEADASLEGPTRGELKVRVAAPSGPFAVGARGLLVVHVTDGDGRELDDAEVKVAAPGANVVRTAPTANGGADTLAITPTFHVVNVEVDATSGGRTGHWEGSLPVVPGAMALATEGQATKIVSPALRRRAYASIWSRRGRAAGEAVDLWPTPDGTSASRPLDRAHWGGDAVAVTLSSDANEDGVGTITWPLARGRCSPPSLALLVDGMPQAVAAERGRAWRVRRWGLLVLAAAAAAEILLMLARSRRAQQRLEAHLAEASGDLDAETMRAAESPAAYWALASAGLIAFAFAIVAALAAFR